ncbi:MAG: hypothetical protein KDD58_03230 [Bdellovibrionales bacterium]|nr:hypothetical protein [Bdellovibrionales bacterium]
MTKNSQQKGIQWPESDDRSFAGQVGMEIFLEQYSLNESYLTQKLKARHKRRQ